MTDRARGSLLGSVVLVLMWSSGFIGADLGTRFAPAMTLLAWRFAAAAAILITAALLLRVRMTGLDVRRHAAMGLLSQAGYLGGTVVGVGLGVPAGTAALIAALQPLAVSVLAPRLVGETTSPRQRIGLIVGLAGVGLVVLHDVGAGGVPAWAYLLPLLGMLSLTAGTLLQRRWQSDVSVLGSLTTQTAVAATIFMIIAILVGDARPPATPAFWGSVAWVVVLSSFGGYGAYIFALHRQGATRVSTLLYLTPPTTMLWAYLMFGDRIGGLSIAGTLVCAAGVVLTLWVRRSSHPQDHTEHPAPAGSGLRRQ